MIWTNAKLLLSGRLQDDVWKYPQMRWKNVFVLCTGRCGSTTFIHAARHAKNATAGHETRTHLTGPARLSYPQDHIEADNRLSWLLGRLDEAYGTEAFYVHLKRDPEAVAASFVKRAGTGILRAYRTDILMQATKKNRAAGVEDFAHDYIRTVTQNIRLFLRDKPHQMEMNLETAQADFSVFWERIGAQGDLDAALSEWNMRYNSSPGQEVPA